MQYKDCNYLVLTLGETKVGKMREKCIVKSKRLSGRETLDTSSGLSACKLRLDRC